MNAQNRSASLISEKWVHPSPPADLPQRLGAAWKADVPTRRVSRSDKLGSKPAEKGACEFFEEGIEQVLSPGQRNAFRKFVDECCKQGALRLDVLSALYMVLSNEASGGHKPLSLREKRQLERDAELLDSAADLMEKRKLEAYGPLTEMEGSKRMEIAVSELRLLAGARRSAKSVRLLPSPWKHLAKLVKYAQRYIGEKGSYELLAQILGLEADALKKRVLRTTRGA